MNKKQIAAFPRPIGYSPGCGYSTAQDGMSLRDYFATKAMSVMIADLFGCDDADRDKVMDVIAIESYKMADAMLKAR